MEDLKDVEIVFKQTQNNTEGMLELFREPPQSYEEPEVISSASSY